MTQKLRGGKVLSIVGGLAAVVGGLAFASGCGGGASISVKEPDPPVGKPQLPDIAPAPALDAHMSHEGGRQQCA